MRRLLLSCSVALAGCGAAAHAADAPPPQARVQLAGGLIVPVPQGWSLATRLTPLAGPLERFTLSSSPLPSGSQDNCGPREAVRRLPADGVLAFVIEYTDRSGRRGVIATFPPRSRGLRVPAGPAVPLECLGVGRSLAFRVGSRAFQALLVFGERAPAARVHHLLTALTRMRVAAQEP